MVVKLLFQDNCALYEERMRFLQVLLHHLSLNFRCVGKLGMTSEGGHFNFNPLYFFRIQRMRTHAYKSYLLSDQHTFTKWSKLSSSLADNLANEVCLDELHTLFSADVTFVTQNLN